MRDDLKLGNFADQKLVSTHFQYFGKLSHLWQCGFVENSIFFLHQTNFVDTYLGIWNFDCKIEKLFDVEAESQNVSPFLLIEYPKVG